MPTLVSRSDAFFQQSNITTTNNISANNNHGGSSDPPGSAQSSPEHRLLNKFHTLWTFQRERLLGEMVARMSIFLNPSTCHQANRPFPANQWREIEAAIVEEISQACLPNSEEIDEGELAQRRAEIEVWCCGIVEGAPIWNNS